MAPRASRGTSELSPSRGNWSPRFGVTVDPFGEGKTKIYYNFGRFHELHPTRFGRAFTFDGEELLQRSLRAGVHDGRWPSRALINQFGTVNPVVNSAHLLNRAAGGFPNNGITISLQDHDNPILPGTKLGYAQEHVFGFEHQLPGNMVFPCGISIGA